MIETSSRADAQGATSSSQADGADSHRHPRGWGCGERGSRRQRGECHLMAKRKKRKTVDALTHDDANPPQPPFRRVPGRPWMRRWPAPIQKSPTNSRNRDLDPQLVWRGKDVIRPRPTWWCSAAAALHPGEGAPQGVDRRSDA